MNRYFQTPTVVKNLIIVNVLVYMAQSMLGGSPDSIGAMIDRWGALHWFGSDFFRSYQFITYMFMHGSFSHLFFNMFALWMFGRTLEMELGAKRFLIYYMVCGVGAALIQLFAAGLANEFYISLVGASGATMGLLLAFGVMHPNAIIMLMIPPIPLKAKYFVVIYGLIELFMGVSGRGGEVAHFAHIGGMLWGLILLYYWRSKGKVFF